MGQELLPGLDHIANFLNALDTEGMTANDVRSAVYAECLKPDQRAGTPPDGEIGALVERLRECAAVYEQPPFRDEPERQAHVATASIMRESADALEAFAAHQEELLSALEAAEGMFNTDDVKASAIYKKIVSAISRAKPEVGL